MGSGGSRINSTITSKKFKNNEKKLFSNRSVSYPTDLATLKSSQHETLHKKTLPRIQTEQIISNGGHQSLPRKVKPVKTPSKDVEWSISELYNVLVAETWEAEPQLHSEEYLMLVDCRSLEEYKHSHIVTAVHSSNLQTDSDNMTLTSQPSFHHMIVLYGNNRKKVAELVRDQNNFTVNMIYEDFYSKFPFLCTNNLINNQFQRKKLTKTWPSEVIPLKLYQGTAKHALNETVIKNLGITHIVNITSVHPNAFSDNIKYLRIQLDDVASSDLLSWLPRTTAFIESAIGKGFSQGDTKDKTNNKVLVHCNMGRSRSSTIVLGYLMRCLCWSLQDACDWLKECRQTVKPNDGFLNQLMLYEVEVFGKQLSDFNKLPL